MNARILFRHAAILALAAGLSGCASDIYYRQQLAEDVGRSATRKLAIFFDGTANDVESDTNVKRLHSLTTLRNDPALAALYVEGVGASDDLLIGGVFGVGFEKRVLLGYNFLRNNYRDGDAIYLFGFSRGAFQARVLASMLHYIGLPDKPPEIKGGDSFDRQAEEARDWYREMKGAFNRQEFPCAIARLRYPADMKHAFKPRNVKAMGLWDTVEALGGHSDYASRFVSNKPFQVDIDEPNDRYGDQLLNVEHVFHAVSLDDNREWLFTPLLVTRPYLVDKKSRQLPERNNEVACNGSRNEPWTTGNADAKTRPLIREVWFAGAHSDVGGGYIGSDLSGVSLNWMLENLSAQSVGLLPRASVREDPYGTSHYPSGDALYKRDARNLAAYALGGAKACDLLPHVDAEMICSPGMKNAMPPSTEQSVCMHPSVFKRRQAMPPKAHENRLLTLRAAGKYCVKAKKESPKEETWIKPTYPPVLEQADCDSSQAQLQITTWTSSSNSDSLGECK